MSGMDRLTDEALIAGWENLKDNLPTDGHDAAEALFDYGDKLADALSRRSSQAAPAPSDGLREAEKVRSAAINRLEAIYDENEFGDRETWPHEFRKGYLEAISMIRFWDIKDALEPAALTPSPAQEGKRTAKPVCPICKGHSRFDQCSCHYEAHHD